MKANKETSLLVFTNPDITLWFKDKYLKSFNQIEYVAVPSAGLDDYEVACSLCGLDAFAKINPEHNDIGKQLKLEHGAYIHCSGKYLPVYTVEHELKKVKELLSNNSNLSVMASDNKGLYYLVSLS